MQNKKISILFLTYNRMGVTIRCLLSLLPSLLQNENIHWVILDNGSTDKLPVWLWRLKRKYPDRITLYLSGLNLGVAGGRQYMLDRLPKNTDIVGFLDNDVQAHSDTWYAPMIEKLEDLSIGIIGQGGQKLLPNWQYQHFSPNYHGYAEFISGFCQFFRYRDFRKHRLYINQEFNYGGAEDSDFCLQWIEKGYKNYMLGDLPIHHVYSGTWDTSMYEDHMKKLKTMWSDKIILLQHTANQ